MVASLTHSLFIIILVQKPKLHNPAGERAALGTLTINHHIDAEA
jgi:hypothetical protein